MAAIKKTSASTREAKHIKQLIRKINAFLDARKWRIVYAKMQGSTEFADIVGLCDHDEQIIYIDYRKDVLSTLVHECLHAIDSYLSEGNVAHFEKLIIETITPRQAEVLHNRLAKYFYKKSSPKR